MTRTISTKFIATALAVASLGFAGTAQAQAPAQGIAIGEPPPGQLPPGTQVNPEPEPDPNPVIVDPEPGTETGKATGEVDYTSPAYLGSKDSHDRFKRYCNMKDAEPSHSDKKFCEEYRKHHGTTGAAKPDPTGASKATGSTGASKATGSTGASKATGSNRASKATGSTGASKATGSAGASKATGSQQAERHQLDEQPSEAGLPLTGLELWLLALLGVALVGGGLGARRLLAS